MFKLNKTNYTVILVITIISLTSYQSLSLDNKPLHHTSSTTQKQSHQFSPSVSNQLSESIKIKIITNLSTFTDQEFAQQLKEDLNQDNDKNRKLKQISPQSAEELFKIFNLQGIVCDKNGDGIIIKEELQCLNYIWKYYVPEDPVNTNNVNGK